MIVCAKCNRAMRPKRSGVSFVEMAGGKPYKLWMGDLWACQTCGVEVLHSSTSQKPIAEHFQPDFADKLAQYPTNYFAMEWNR
jgi:hypothetical protein